MSLNQRRREAAFRQTSPPIHNLNILSAKPTCWQCVPEGVSNLEWETNEQLHHVQAELQQYRLLYDNIPTVYLSLDVTGLILSVNSFGASCLGYTPEQLQKQPIFQLFSQPEQQRLADEFTSLLTNKPKYGVKCGNFRLDCPLSQMQWVKIVLRLVLEDGQEPVILMVGEDVTADVSYEEKNSALSVDKSDQTETIPEKLDELASLTHLQEEFISTVSHELRTPLTNMKMAIQMLGIALRKEKQLLDDVDSSRVVRYFEILNKECDRQINLINNFLDLKRVEAVSQPLVLETIHIEQWLWQVVEKFKQHQFYPCQQNLSLNIAPSLPTLRCNSLHLERIVRELLTNAGKFSPPDAAIIVTAEQKANKIHLQVTNYGVEIPSTELPHIFDKFYRIPSNDPTKQGGTGLGLTLVQKLTKQLGGTIKVESGSNRTCFTLVVNSH